MIELLVPRISDGTAFVAVLVRDHGLVQPTPEGVVFVSEFTFGGQTVESRYEVKPGDEGLQGRMRADAATLAVYDLDLMSAKHHP